jgi:hypothetical protein
LLEALGQLVYELEGVIDACDAEEKLAVAHCVLELRVRAHRMQRLIDKLDPCDDMEEEDDDE